MARDPVCGAEVDEAHAPATSRHGGVTYYFESFACKHRFDLDPQRYAAHPAPPSGGKTPPGTA